MVCATQIFLEAAGFEVPLTAFLGILAGWRILSTAWQLLRPRPSAARAPAAGSSMRSLRRLLSEDETAGVDEPFVPVSPVYRQPAKG